MQSRKFTARKLQNYDPRITAKYLKLYKKFLKYHKLEEKLDTLQANIAKDGLTEAYIEEWHDIDTLRRKGMEIAERKCRKFKVGKVPWSPEIALVMMVKLAWSLILRKLKGCKIGKNYLKRTMHQADLKWEDRLVTVEVAEQHHKDAIKAFRYAARTAVEARTSWLERLTAAIGKKQRKDKAKVLKELKAHEKQRVTARLVRRAHNTLHADAGVRMVLEVVGREADKNLILREHTSQKGVVEVVINEATGRFWQGKDTPFQTSPLIDKVGWLAEKEGAREILETGSITLGPNDPSLYDFTIDFIKSLKRPDHIKPLTVEEVEITLEKHIRSWKRAKEKTLGGDVFMHFGHFIAGIQDPEIATFEASMRNIPFKHGFSPRSCRRTMDFTLLKEPGNFLIKNYA